MIRKAVAAGRVARLDQVTVDAVVAVALTVVSVAAAVFPDADTRARYAPLDAIGLVLIIGQTLPLAFRQRFPMAVFAITGTSISLYSLLGFPPSAGPIGVLVALYTVAANTNRATALAAAAITAVGILVSILSIGVRANVSLGELALEIAANYVIYATAWILGDNVRVRRAYTAELEARAALLEREREELARLAVSEERARIARELHDIVAHRVSVMVVQASAARRVLTAAPEQAADALTAIEETGREALGEMRGMLGVLRSDDGADALGPQPGLDRLELLLDDVRDAGLAVELVIEGTPRPLPPGVDLSAYRIVQEALTNTLKHAGTARASVRVRYGERDVEVEVVDDGRGAAAAVFGDADRGPRHGLIGMRERVALFGGDLTAGPRPSGGYAVTARLPLEGARS